MNTQKLNSIVAEAKSKTSDPKWLRSLEKAAKMMASGELVVTVFADNTALVTSPNGSYRVNGTCPCAARTAHCYHRCAKRIAQLMDAPEETAPTVSTREEIIDSIKTQWASKFPTVSLARELECRFLVNDLRYLADDMLAGALSALA